jgi:hypothetical protein
MKKITLTLAVLALIAVFNISCKKEVTDAQKVEALKNVTVSYDSVALNLSLPEGALSGQTFAELRANNEALYSNLANYTIGFTTYLKANNTKSGATDAAFQGMAVNLIMNNLTGTPIQTSTGPVTILANEIKPVTIAGNINLLTHKLVGKYIFQQTVDGNDLATKIAPILKYQIGVLQGDLNLPEINQNIPTRASQNTKNFLSGLLASDLMN